MRRNFGPFLQINEEHHFGLPARDLGPVFGPVGSVRSPSRQKVKKFVQMKVKPRPFHLWWGETKKSRKTFQNLCHVKANWNWKTSSVNSLLHCYHTMISFDSTCQSKFTCRLDQNSVHLLHRRSAD
jgi:hypothetical protein